MGNLLSYREAAARVNRSIRSINRWRRAGHLTMGWDTRDGQRIRVVDEKTLLECFRERLNSDPAHQYRLRRMRSETESDTPNAQYLLLSGVIPQSQGRQE